MGQIRKALLALTLAGVLQALIAGQKPKFFPDDPIQKMPPPLPVGALTTSHVNSALDSLRQSRNRDPRPPSPAEAINTLGEVPDSEWFTNRHGMRRMTREELQQVQPAAEAPEPPFTITNGKFEGITPGFEMEDARGRRYFAKVDSLDYPELTTAPEVITAAFYHAIGYYTPRTEIIQMQLSDIRLSDNARAKLPTGRSRKMVWNDVEELVRRIPQYQDRSFRVVVSLAVEGDYVGPFRYEETRPGDPNDVTPHDKRRDLRGLYVVSAWLNNTDMKAGNTLDTMVEENGVRFVRHYLIDFGTSLGSLGDRPKEVQFGHEYIVPTISQSLSRAAEFGVKTTPWERASLSDLPGVGAFEAESLDPDKWKPHFPNPAFLSRLPDDDFWAAKQVMAFTDDDIRAIVEMGKLSDPRSADYITSTLIQRRDKIGRTFFSKVLPLDRFRIENDRLVFDDLAAIYGFRPARKYEVEWSRFDNYRHTHDSLSSRASSDLPVEAKQSSPGQYFCAVITAPNEHLKVWVYLRKEHDGFKVVGVERNW